MIEQPVAAIFKPELLAPAGSLDSFHAAVDAGADAVYLGLEEFNARLRTANFSLRTLSHIVPYAHANSVKVYVALNTLVKQHELGRIIDALHAIQQIGVDAVIVQDVGLCRIIARYFPKLAVHASTQMVIHNSAGCETAQRLGIRRAILSRELTLDEIAAIRQSVAIELEVFVHGALCYSISGLCLCSSFLGGSSGNRGRCTQACRRRYERGDGGSGFYFSPNDFCALDYVARFGQIGIQSVKIEGRMRSAEYVHIAVSAYRMVLDDPGNPVVLDRARSMVRYDFGRAKTSFFLDSSQPRGVIVSQQTAGTGIRLGDIRSVRDGVLIFKCSETIEPGDRIRIHPKSGNEGQSAKVKAVTIDNGLMYCTVAFDGKAEAGDTVYLISRAAHERLLKKDHPLTLVPAKFETSYPQASSILRAFERQKAVAVNQTKTDRLIIRVDCVEWLRHLGKIQYHGVWLCADHTEIGRLLSDRSLLARLKETLAIVLPPFIPQDQLEQWRAVLAQCAQAGITQFGISTIGQASLVDGRGTVFTDTGAWCLNRAAQQALSQLGINQATCSVEDDYDNVTAIVRPDDYVYLFSYVPLFTARLMPAAPDNTELQDSHTNLFLTARRNGLYYMIGQKPFCIFHKREDLHECGVRNFVVDVSFCSPNTKTIHTIVSHYQSGERIAASSVFNFKLGLK